MWGAKPTLVLLTAPGSAAPRHMISTPQLEMMKRTAFLINLCRGPVWDEVAVCEALKTKRIAGAATDVFETEPAPADHPLLQLDNFVATPPRSASTAESLEPMRPLSQDVIAALSG